MAVPYTFGSATSSIPLSQLDSNFATGITLGNTTVYLGNTTTSFGNVSLTNVTISSVSTAITPAQGGTGLITIPANNVILGNGTSNVAVVAPGTSGNVLTSNGTTWSSSTISAASVSAAGSTTQVQYNNAGAFAGSANLTFNGTTLTAAGLSGPHNGTVGATTPSTGSFTTLAASSTVSGTGFSTYLASPPAIGGTAPAAGAFTTLTASTPIGTASGGTGLSSFTSGGVVYASSSSALATGSALQFDGSTLSVNGTAGANIFQSNDTSGATSFLRMYADAANGGPVINTKTGDSFRFANTTTGSSFAGFNELMRISSATGSLGTVGIGYTSLTGVGASGLAVLGNVGFGTSSPDVKLSVVGDAKIAGNGTYALLTMKDATASGSAYVLLSGFPALGDFTLREAGVGNHLTIKKTSGNAVFAGNIGIGGTTPTTSGTGITFPATQSASSDANTLDDYEEGTWTPNQGSGLTVVGTYTPSGKYTKIGRSVTVTAYIAATTSVAFSLNSQLCSNLPFPPIEFENAGILISDSRNSSQAVSALSASEVQSSAVQSAVSGVSFTITYFV